MMAKKKPRKIKATPVLGWGVFVDGRLDWLFVDEECCCRAWAVYRTRAEALSIYGDIRRVEVREL